MNRADVVRMADTTASFPPEKSVGLLRIPPLHFQIWRDFDLMFDRKREDLMNQIRVRDAQLRDQAAQIQELAKLTKELKLSKKRRSPSFSLSEENASPPADLHSPLPNNTDLEDSDEDCAKPEVKDWMEKARESVEAGGF